MTPAKTLTPGALSVGPRRGTLGPLRGENTESATQVQPRPDEWSGGDCHDTIQRRARAGGMVPLSRETTAQPMTAPPRARGRCVVFMPYPVAGELWSRLADDPSRRTPRVAAGGRSDASPRSAGAGSWTAQIIQSLDSPARPPTREWSTPRPWRS